MRTGCIGRWQERFKGSQQISALEEDTMVHKKARDNVELENTVLRNTLSGQIDDAMHNCAMA